MSMESVPDAFHPQGRPERVANDEILDEIARTVGELALFASHTEYGRGDSYTDTSLSEFGQVDLEISESIDEDGIEREISLLWPYEDDEGELDYINACLVNTEEGWLFSLDEQYGETVVPLLERLIANRLASPAIIETARLMQQIIIENLEDYTDIGIAEEHADDAKTLWEFIQMQMDADGTPTSQDFSYESEVLGYPVFVRAEDVTADSDYFTGSNDEANYRSIDIHARDFSYEALVDDNGPVYAYEDINERIRKIARMPSFSDEERAKHPFKVRRLAPDENLRNHVDMGYGEPEFVVESEDIAVMVGPIVVAAEDEAQDIADAQYRKILVRKHLNLEVDQARAERVLYELQALVERERIESIDISS